MSNHIVISNNQAEAAENLVKFIFEKIELVLKDRPFVTIGLSGNCFF